MPVYTQTDLDHLISCPKQIVDPPARQLKLAGGYWRNNARMASTDGIEGTFSMFMRKNEDFSENFSVGLTFSANDGSPEITLLRCNGKHGIFTGSGDVNHPHWDFHIHRASEEAMSAGYAAEKFAQRTTAFASYEQAVQHFLQVVSLNAQDASKFFPSAIQIDLNLAN